MTLSTQIAFRGQDSIDIRLQLKLADRASQPAQNRVTSPTLNAIANSNAFDPTGFYDLGNAFARLGDNEAAIAAYRKAIKQRKGFTRAR